MMNHQVTTVDPFLLKYLIMFSTRLVMISFYHNSPNEITDLLTLLSFNHYHKMLKIKLVLVNPSSGVLGLPPQLQLRT
ncbi:unnamed protein product [Musa textilis]